MPNPIDLLIVDDDTDYRGLLVRRFKRREYQVHEACDGIEALELAHRRQFDVAIVDMTMPGITGLEVLEKLKALQPECEVIMHTGQASIETAVKAMKIGAYDYLVKPCPMVECEALVEKAVERRQLAKENVQLKELLQRRPPEPEMIGESAAIKEVWRLIERAGPTDKAILIQGESGTGKELVARALHRRSSRADKQLVAINCAALPETLLESELFGHEKGAFTGAVSAKPGFFEVADGGTLFIDEVGEMPGSLQAKLLRVLEDGSMRRVGSIKERRVDVRLVGGHESRYGRGDQGRPVPRRPLLSNQRHVVALAAAARADGRSAVAGEEISWARLADRTRRDAGHRALPVARQHSPIDQRDRSGQDSGR